MNAAILKSDVTKKNNNLEDDDGGKPSLFSYSHALMQLLLLCSLKSYIFANDVLCHIFLASVTAVQQ